MMPLSAPAVITLIVVNALWVWNELLIALVFMQKDELKTLMVGIAALRSRNYVDIPATMAGSADRHHPDRYRVYVRAALLHPRPDRRSGEIIWMEG